MQREGTDMTQLLLYYAHPGHRFSQVNRTLWEVARGVGGITRVDLYAEYPRFNIDIDREQDRLKAHDVIVFQYPLFWYATPSLLKEWMDLVLEHGFAYGTGGTALKGKTMLVAVSAAGPEDAYTETGYQRYPLRTFLTPMERTAGLCKMRFLAPYTLYAALRAPEDGRIGPHAAGYARLLEGLRDGRLDLDRAAEMETMDHETLPLREEV